MYCRQISMSVVRELMAVLIIAQTQWDHMYATVSPDMNLTAMALHAEVSQSESLTQQKYSIDIPVDYTSSAIHTDVDECTTGTNLCAQNCTNLDGSYSCSCGLGYQLNIDGLQCDGNEGL